MASTTTIPVPIRTRPSADRYANKDDWIRYMPTIKNLYIDENKTLKEVMEVMKKQHHFFATVKMYKVRLRQWGLSKYIKTKAEDVAALPNLLGGGERRGPVRLASGRVVSADRLAAQLLRKMPDSAIRKGSQLPRSRCVGTQMQSPRAMAIKPPDTLYISEAVLAGTCAYVGARMMDMAFAERKNCAAITITFYNSRNLFREGKPDEAVALLRQAPQQMVALLRAEPPRILEHLFMVITYLRNIPGEPVMKSIEALVRYAAAAAAELGWAPQHPLRRILSSFAAINEQDALAQFDMAARGWKRLIEMLDSHLGVPVCARNFYRWLLLSDSSGYDVLPGTYLAERQWGVYRKIAAECGEVSFEAAQELFYLAQLEQQKVEACGGSQANVQRLLEWTLQSIPEGMELNARCDSQLHLAQIYKEQGHVELAEWYLRAGIDSGIRRDGEQHPECLQRIVELEGWLMEWGEDAKVAELQLWKTRVRAKLEGAGQ